MRAFRVAALGLDCYDRTIVGVEPRPHLSGKVWEPLGRIGYEWAVSTNHLNQALFASRFAPGAPRGTRYRPRSNTSIESTGAGYPSSDGGSASPADTGYPTQSLMWGHPQSPHCRNMALYCVGPRAIGDLSSAADGCVRFGMELIEGTLNPDLADLDPLQSRIHSQAARHLHAEACILGEGATANRRLVGTKITTMTEEACGILSGDAVESRTKSVFECRNRTGCDAAQV